MSFLSALPGERSLLKKSPVNDIGKRAVNIVPAERSWENREFETLPIIFSNFARSMYLPRRTSLHLGARMKPDKRPDSSNALILLRPIPRVEFTPWMEELPAVAAITRAQRSPRTKWKI